MLMGTLDISTLSGLEGILSTADRSEHSRIVAATALGKSTSEDAWGVEGIVWA
jgi:hypothetical protein